MITVRDLYEVVVDETLGKLPVVACFGDYKINLTSHYIVDGILYLLNEETDDKEWNAEGLRWFIDTEAEDDEWKPIHAVDASAFCECEVRVCDGFFDSPESVFYYVAEIKVKEDEVVLILSLDDSKEEEAVWSVTLNSSLDGSSKTVQGTTEAVKKYIVKEINEYMHVGDCEAAAVTIEDIEDNYIIGGFGIMVHNCDGKGDFIEIYACVTEPEVITRLDSDGNPIKSKEVA